MIHSERWDFIVNGWWVGCYCSCHAALLQDKIKTKSRHKSGLYTLYNNSFWEARSIDKMVNCITPYFCAVSQCRQLPSLHQISPHRHRLPAFTSVRPLLALSVTLGVWWTSEHCQVSSTVSLLRCVRWFFCISYSHYRNALLCEFHLAPWFFTKMDPKWKSPSVCEYLWICDVWSCPKYTWDYVDCCVPFYTVNRLVCSCTCLHTGYKLQGYPVDSLRH